MSRSARPERLPLGAGDDGITVARMVPTKTTGPGRVQVLEPPRLEVRTKGPRDGVGWELVADRAAPTEQPSLFGRHG